MRKLLLIAVVLLQAFALAYMAAERERVLRTGRVIHLRTAPIDPRDAMRGDCLRLQYEISTVPRELLRDGLAKTGEPDKHPRPDTRVYASLRVNEEGLAELVSLSDQRPSDGLFIRGRLTWDWGTGVAGVRYGLEAFFMEHTKAEDLGKQRDRQGIQVPLEMAVAVASLGDPLVPGGLAVIKDYRWSALGIGLDLERERPTEFPDDQRGGRVLAAKIRLLNAGANDLAIVDLPGGRSLALVPDVRWGGNDWRWACENQPVPAAKPEDVIVLKPGQIHAIRVDFKDPVWFVVGGKRILAQKKQAGAQPGEASRRPRSLSDLAQEWNARFRVEYRTPIRSACNGLPNAQLIWHGRLPSRIFSTVGTVD